METYTVRFGRDGAPLDGVVIARTPAGERLMARVAPDDAASMALCSYRPSARRSGPRAIPASIRSAS
ncbi:hypothetical protein ACRAWD_10310 [Caulobacter segnis]